MICRCRARARPSASGQILLSVGWHVLQPATQRHLTYQVSEALTTRQGIQYNHPSKRTRGKIFIHASTIITTNKTPYSSVDINISLLHRVYYISRIFDSHDLHVSMDDFFFIPISTSMEHKARRYHNPRLRLPSLPPATNFAASIACMASFAAVRGNQVEKKFRIS